MDTINAPEETEEKSELQTELVARTALPQITVPLRLTKEEAARRKLENDQVLKQEPHSLWYYSWRRLRRNRLAMAGLVTTIVLVFVAVFASKLAPFDPNMQVLEYSTEPIAFRGNVLLTKSEVNPNETVPVPIAEYHIQGGNVLFTTVEGQDHSLPLSRLAGTF